MKKILSIIILFSCIRSGYSQWLPISSGTSANLNDVFFPTASIGYAVGNYGTVLKSIDAGNTWSTVATIPTVTLQSVYFTSADTGYAAGDQLYKTTNGGSNWSVILTDISNIFVEVYFVNSQLGFAGAYGKLYKTVNAGNTWSVVLSGATWSAIHFPSPNVGYFIGGNDFGNPLYKTIDGGQNFIQISNGFQSIKSSVFFLNDMVGYMIGWYAPLLAKTNNGGVTWVQDTMNWPGGFDCYFIDQSKGYYIDNGGGVSIIRNTINSGTTWDIQLSLAGGWLNKFFFINSNTAVAIGNNGAIYKTTNGGVGIQENKNKETGIRVFPNPATESISIQTTIDVIIKTIKLYDINGKLIKSFLPTDTDLNIDDIAKGRYNLIITTNKEMSSNKIIKQ